MTCQLKLSFWDSKLELSYYEKRLRLPQAENATVFCYLFLSNAKAQA